MSAIKRIFDPGSDGVTRDVGIFVLRLGLGITMATHGLSKLQAFGENASGFPDPIGVGPQASMALAIFAELVCSILVALGASTRVAALPVAFTMLVAFFVIHAGDPFGERELAWTYLVGFVAILLTGPGKISIDGAIRAR